MNEEQAKSFERWVSATIGPFLISHGYLNDGNLQLILGIFVSLAPLIWSMFNHTQSNAVAVVDALAKDPANPVKAVILQSTSAGRELAEAIPGNTTVIAGTVAATAAAER
jgi:hypothetical protein